MVYIVILTWNGMKYLPKLFKSLGNLDFNKEKLKIVVVDSGSTDGSREYLESLDNVHLIKLDKNLGFVKGNNLGMQYALDDKAKYLVLLNQDMEVKEDFLNHLIHTAESNEKIGVVQPLIMYYNKKDQINSKGNLLHYLGYGYCEGNHEKVIDNKKTKEITYASAAAVLYKSKMLKDVGLFDENIFSYHEDSEICLRARLRGYSAYLEPKSIVYHDYSFPTGKNKERYFWMEKNRIYIILKFYKLKTIFLILPMIWFMDLGQIYFAVTKGYFYQWLKSRFWFIFNFRKFYKARNKIQKNRQISDKELTRNFSSVIEYQEVDNFLLNKIANPVMKFYWKLVRKII
ncbi:MAG: glycosyltransferase family 2 protein [Candidatus Woesearchaeota archaeon]